VSGSSAAEGADQPLVIPPDAACPAAARQHVASALRRLERPELLDASALAVTELATNAALHARTPVTVTVQLLPGDEVRIEVGDGSPVMPHEHPRRPTSTVGRGLHLVESLGSWGVEPVVEQGRVIGKVVWFSPGPDTDPAEATAPNTPTSADAVTVAVERSDRTPDDGAGVVGRYLTADPPQGRWTTPTTLLTVRLLNFPLRVFLDVREHHDELMRELALLCLQGDQDSAALDRLPPRLTVLVDLLGRRYGAVGERGHPARDAAMARGDLTADLSFHVTSGAVTDLLRLGALLAEADAFCRDGTLLTMPRPPLYRAFVDWYEDEFVRQRLGRPPSPWRGPVIPGSFDQDG
jgi:anti-sigma regulatory factor (Ser/Thr protein kinase)